MKNHEKRFGQASSGRSTRPRKRSYQTAAAMPGGVAKRGCTRARCSTSGSRNYADSKDNACDARHGARKVQIARCSASTSKNCKISFCTFGIQLKNHEKRCGQASSGRSTRPRKRSYQTAAAMPGEVAKRGCTRARCSTSGSREYADSEDKACDARHGARVVQIARCSASTSKNCKIWLHLWNPIEEP